MTILHVADLHFNKRWFCWLSESAPAHDLLAISGDLLDLEHPLAPARQAAWVAAWAQEHSRPLALCSGYHDLEWNAYYEVWYPAYWLKRLAGPRVYVDGHMMQFDGSTLHCIACTARPKGMPADIWVVHTPPAGLRIARRRSGRDAGDFELRVAVQRHRPRLVLCGQVHDPTAWCDTEAGTLFLNPGQQSRGRYPNHILIDLATLEVLHRVADEESARQPALVPTHVDAAGQDAEILPA